MSKSVEQLLLVLNKEQEVYNAIVALSKDKQSAIVNNKIEVLEEIVKKEKTYSISLVKLEEIREKILNQLVKDYNLIEINRISDLYPYMSENDVREIDHMKQKLINTVELLSQKNDLNKQLIEQSLEQIEFDLNLITTVGEGNVNYSGDADDKDVERRSLFDRRI